MDSKLYGYESRDFVDHFNDYRDGASLEDPNSILYGRQKEVELLPVPDLKVSIALYLQSIRPLASPQEYTENEALAKRFLEGMGPVLQERLLERAAKRTDTSWFAEWWNEYAYLGYRESIIHNVSYYLQFQDEPSHAMDQCRRAARLIFHAANYRKQVITSTLKPDMRKNGKPRSNTQWKFIFNTCRMPGDKTDFVRTFAGDIYGHVIVICKNHLFSLSVCGSNMVPMSIDEIESSLMSLKSFTENIGTNPFSPAVLSGDHRDTWARNYRQLCNNKTNAASFKELQSAMFVVCLDDTKPTTREQIGEFLLHSPDGRNRFWDKSFQFVVFQNGKAGYVGEHAMADGLTSTRFVNEMLETLFADTEATKLKSSSSKQPNVFPKRIFFEETGAIQQEISDYLVRFKQNLADKELSVLMFHAFGKNKIKTFKCSPDAFAQVAIQLAYYKTFGYCRATYESTQTRSFLHGRTEVTRSCTMEALNFSRHLVDVQSPTTDHESEAYGLLMKAISAHSSYIRKASQAKGCDRHLLGLKLSLKPGEDDSLFKNKIFTSSGSWSISTSGLVGEKMDGWGFGEVVLNGIGVGYSVQSSRLRFTVTSGHKSDNWASSVCANLEWALLEMGRLCQVYTPLDKSKL